MTRLKCVKCKTPAMFSIHGKCQCGYDAPKRYNVGGTTTPPERGVFKEMGYSSKRAAARASRAAGNTGGTVKK